MDREQMQRCLEAGGGVPGLWPKERGVGCGQRCSGASAGELVRPFAALAGTA